MATNLSRGLTPDKYCLTCRRSAGSKDNGRGVIWLPLLVALKLTGHLDWAWSTVLLVTPIAFVVVRLLIEGILSAHGQCCLCGGER